MRVLSSVVFWVSVFFVRVLEAINGGDSLPAIASGEALSCARTAYTAASVSLHCLSSPSQAAVDLYRDLGLKFQVLRLPIYYL